MSETAASADLYSAIEASAGLLDVPCSREKVWPVLNAYEDALASAVIAFRVGTGERYTGDLDWRFSVPQHVDPYAVALAKGLTEATDHPVGTLLADINERCPIDSYGIDFGVVGGFKKIYAFFAPDGMQRLSTLIDIPSMPISLAENFDFFARYGLDADKVNVFGIDYRHRTVNLYFGGLPAQCLEPETITAMLRDIGFPEPSEQMLKLGGQAFGIYTTLGWDSPEIERFCFSVMTPDSVSLPVPIEPKIEKFLDGVPHDSADGRFIYYAAMSATGEENFKVQSYYQWQSRMQGQMLLSDSDEQQGKRDS
ncbi:aromatic prenyltransferase [Streptomyces sp. NPDC052043]|uniref:aromatic prenyltransferase n=1 Tax=Streptomyces sp. NPDC052043 TaxID=3365684 RepID=UPI0037D64984